MTEAAEPGGLGQGAVVARCAVHPEVQARQTPCARCGGFACEPCFGELEEEVCAACRERVGGGRIPWEVTGPGFFDRLSQTLTKMWSEPRATFRKIGDGAVPPSFTFFLVTLAIGYAPLLLCVPLMGLGLFAYMGSLASDLPGDMSSAGAAGMFCGMVVGLPLYMVFVHLIAVTYFVITFHVTALLLGGRGSVLGSIRAVLYTGGIQPLTALILMVAFIPLIGPLLNLAGQIVKLLWTGFALTGSAESVHRLEGDRALVAGHAPGALLVLLMIAVVVLAVGLALSVRT